MSFYDDQMAAQLGMVPPSMGAAPPAPAAPAVAPMRPESAPTGGGGIFGIPILGSALGIGRDILVGPGAAQLKPQEQIKRGILSVLLASRNPQSLPALWASFGTEDARGRELVNSAPFHRRAMDLGGDNAAIAQAANELGFPSGMKLPSAVPPLPATTDLAETAAETRLGEARRQHAIGGPSGQGRAFEMLGIPRTAEQGRALAAESQTPLAAADMGAPVARQTTVDTGAGSTTYTQEPGSTMQIGEAKKLGYLQADGTPNPQYVVAQIAGQPEGTVMVRKTPPEELQRQREYSAQLTAKANDDYDRVMLEAKTEDDRASKLHGFLYDPDLIKQAGFAVGPHKGGLDEDMYRISQWWRTMHPGTEGNQALATLVRRADSMVTNVSRDYGGEKGVVTDRDISERAIKNMIQGGDTIQIINQKSQDFDTFTQELRKRKAMGNWKPPAGEHLVDNYGRVIPDPAEAAAGATTAPASLPATPMRGTKVEGVEGDVGIDPEVAATIRAMRKGKK
jgi:hypothetical protein